MADQTPPEPMVGDMTAADYWRAVALCDSAARAAHDDDGGPTVVGTFLGRLGTLLGVEPVDDKGRTPTYLRGESDGANAARAGVEPHDGGPVHEWVEVHLTGNPPHSPPYDFTFRSDAKAWEHEPRLVQLARGTWADVSVRTRHVRQVTYSTDWAEQPAPETAQETVGG